ncbi:MFS transporter [Streptantibioticus rubrisoli]|uniref:MFS transporter n=1 Tax=Streptantibioticus rubrisoli TaxID=1387313 RepID=A0ABT1PE38_9ACTN|nr:MFS transporter [Streptantibioticus rubrisoli]MCQ4043066.1 MFS transporter [Streptantibioticus rubrisoli]
MRQAISEELDYQEQHTLDAAVKLINRLADSAVAHLAAPAWPAHARGIQQVKSDTVVATATATRTPGWRLVTPLLVGAALNPVNSSILATALDGIAKSFHIGVTDTAALVSYLYLASAIAQPTMGRLAEHLGPRRVFLAGMALVAAAGALGTLATNLPTLTASRVLLGIGTAGGYPTAMMIVRQLSERDPELKTGGTLGALSAAGLVTAAVGLPIGGALVAASGWRTTFLINVPLALFGMVLTLLWIPRDSRTGRREPVTVMLRKLDPAGMVLFACTITSALVFAGDLSHPNGLLLALTVALAICLIVRERAARHPFIDVRMLAHNRALSATYLRTAVTMLVPYAILYGLPQWLQESRGLSAIMIGLLLLPMSLLASLVAIPFSRRQLVRMPLLAAAGSALGGALVMVFFGHGTPVIVIATVTLLFGVTTGLGSVGNQTALYAQVSPDQIGTASGLLRTFTYLGAILSSSLVGLAFGRTANDAGLHILAIALAALASLLLLTTIASRVPANTL